MDRPRILHVIRPAEGGMKGHLLILARGFLQLGYRIEVACPPDSSIISELADLGVPVHPISLIGPLAPQEDLRCVAQLKNLISRGGFHLVHCHGAKAGLVGRVAALLTGFDNVVVTVHNFIVYSEVPLAKRILFKYGEKLLSRKTRALITVSEALREDLIRQYHIPGTKIHTVYNGINPKNFYFSEADRLAARQSLGIAADAAVVGTLARMAPQKGLPYFIRAVPEVLKRREAVFAIGGDGPLKGELEHLARETGRADRILFRGYITEPRQFFAALDIFVVPSVAEGLSITTIEAMAAGLPVIAARVGGLPELVVNGETGLMIAPRSEKDLAEAILKLLEDPREAAKMGRQGRGRAEETFGIQGMINQTGEVYRALLGKGNHSGKA